MADPRRPVNDEDRRRVTELHAAGKSRNDIARELGRSVPPSPSSPDSRPVLRPGRHGGRNCRQGRRRPRTPRLRVPVNRVHAGPAGLCVLVEDAAELVASSYVESGQRVHFCDRFG
jgi:hypothetical protein